MRPNCENINSIDRIYLPDKLNRKNRIASDPSLYPVDSIVLLIAEEVLLQ